MIIEAGYDILHLLSAAVPVDRDHSDHRDEPGALWILAMDRELRFVFLRKAAHDAHQDLGDHIGDIARIMREETAFSLGYYVVARYSEVALSESGEWLDDAEAALKHSTELEQFEFLGQVVFDPEGFFSTVPRYSFRDYVGLEHLPRPAVCPGPHDADCACAACTQYADRLNRARAHRRSEAVTQ